MMTKSILLKVKSSFALLAFIISSTSVSSQSIERSKPKWFFGQSVGVNFNYYRGFTRQLNETVKTSTPFQAGEGVKPYASLLVEYFPFKNTGIALNLAYDNRGGNFKEVMAPCNCPSNLSTNLSYFSVEPSIKVKPFGGDFYLFGGPTILLNLTNDFTYQQQFQPDVFNHFSQVRKSLMGAQLGLGFDLPLSAKSNPTQIILSPFAAFHTDLGPSPRAIEDWSIYTFRFGIALKMGVVKKVANKDVISTSYSNAILPIATMQNDVQFSARAPKIIPPSRQVKEVLPLRNSVFFDKGSIEIPSRYKQITKDQSLLFKEDQLLQQGSMESVDGRSVRQLAVYHQILNLTGDRMRTAPLSTIYLVGSADNDPVEGKMMAKKVKDYLVQVFQIDSSRITLEGRALPIIPSEQKGGVKELDLLHEGDRRVDIMSLSEGLLEQFGSSSNRELRYVKLVDVQKDPLDSHVIFTNLNASKLLQPWSVTLTDEKGVSQTFGPFTKDVVSVAGKTILKDQAFGNYQVVMNALSKDGALVKKETFVSLRKADEGKNSNAYRFSILFEFDQAKSIASYENFLTKIVAPVITNNSTVIIHGHTDIIGDEIYNQKLSEERAINTQRILENESKKLKKKLVKFEAFGFGEQEAFSPFNNQYPEERFYNRCVIIDIVPPIE